jgi:hypothetical protein
VSRESFVSLLLVGSALLALWIDVRLGTRRPSSFKVIVLNCALAFVALRMIGVAAGALLSPDAPVRTIAALFLVIQPMFVYVFLASLWFLKLLRDSTTGVRW